MLIVQDAFTRISQSETSPTLGQRIPGYMDYQGTGSRPQVLVDRKWALGLQVKVFMFSNIYILKCFYILNVNGNMQSRLTFNAGKFSFFFCVCVMVNYSNLI